MEMLGTRRVVRIGTIALLYALLTLILTPISFGTLQFRISEMLMILCLYSKDSIPALTMGCFAANVFGPYGAPDVILGTLATFISGLLIYKLRKHIGVAGAAAITAVVNAPIVALALMIIGNDGKFVENAGMIAAGELISVMIAGAILRFHIMRIIRVKRFFIDPDPRE